MFNTLTLGVLNAEKWPKTKWKQYCWTPCILYNDLFKASVSILGYDYPEYWSGILDGYNDHRFLFQMENYLKFSYKFEKTSVSFFKRKTI